MKFYPYLSLRDEQATIFFVALEEIKGERRGKSGEKGEMGKKRNVSA